MTNGALLLGLTPSYWTASPIKSDGRVRAPTTQLLFSRWSAHKHELSLFRHPGTNPNHHLHLASDHGHGTGTNRGHQIQRRTVNRGSA